MKTIYFYKTVLYRIYKSAFYIVSYLLYPSICIGCKVLVSRTNIFCIHCWGTIKPVVSLRLPLTKKKALEIFSASAYENPMRYLVVAKFSSQLVASKYLASLILEIVSRNVFDVDYLVPIPLHWSRYAARGYNQSLVMSKVISEKTGIPIFQGLKRTKNTSYQWLYGRKKRLENMEEAFELSSKSTVSLLNKRILLIDDLCTTGATLQSAARILLRTEPLSIRAVVGCRAI